MLFVTKGTYFSIGDFSFLQYEFSAYVILPSGLASIIYNGTKYKILTFQYLFCHIFYLHAVADEKV